MPDNSLGIIIRNYRVLGNNLSVLLDLFSSVAFSTVFDTGGRTVQVLPREAQVTGQIDAQRITIYKEITVHYIPSLHWAGETGRKTHKKTLHG